MTEFEVKSVSVVVTQNDSDVSQDSIGTDSLGPCISFIIDRTLSGKQTCILNHYSFGHDESNESQLSVVMWLLNSIRRMMYKHIFEKNHENLTEQNLGDILLISTGGDFVEGKKIRDACIIICQNSFNFRQYNQVDQELLLIYEKLKENVLLIDSILKMPSMDDEEDDDHAVISDDHPLQLSIKFDSLRKVASLTILWVNDGECFTIGTTNIQIQPSATNSKWSINDNNIKQFKARRPPTEHSEINEALSYIPTNVLVDCAAYDCIVTNTPTFDMTVNKP